MLDRGVAKSRACDLFLRLGARSEITATMIPMGVADGTDGMKSLYHALGQLRAWGNRMQGHTLKLDQNLARCGSREGCQL
ncbi:hypothetical protein CFE70_002198 [Pyrenophora teres f. teres 0-1]